MKKLLLILLTVALTTTLKAQQSPRDEYDVFAKFKDWANFGDYIAENVKQPQSIPSDLKGILAITVLVDSGGNASVYKIGKSISPEVDAVFTKAIADAPLWTPAKYRGKSVPIYFTTHYWVETNKAAQTMTTDASVDKVFTRVESNPSFPRGNTAFIIFLSRNIHYPQDAKQMNIQGQAFVQFIVEVDGSLSDMKILRDPGYGLGEEAMRVLKLSPKWIPGKQNGKTVRVQYTVPVNFALSQY